MNVTCCGIRDCADVTELRICGWGDYSGLSSWALNISSRVLTGGRQEGHRGEDSVMVGAEVGVMQPGSTEPRSL